MSDQVWKYPLVLATEQQIVELPKGAEIVHFGWQGQPILWARVSTDHNETEPRNFFIVGTGHSFLGGTHIGTVQADGFVWHLFERTSA